MKDHTEVTLGYTEDYEPNVIKDKNGNLSGFMIDIYNQLEALTGIKVNIVLDKWPEAIEKYRDGVTDGLLVVATARAKESGSLYTTTISTTAPTIFARSDAPFEVNSEKDLTGKKISVLKNTFVVEKALKPYQDQIEIVETDSALEMLKLVLEGKVDAAFGLSFHSYLIGKYFLSGIKPVYYASSLETKGVTAIRPDWPEFVSIINKGLAEIGEGKLNQIHDKWLQAYPETKIKLSESEKAWLAQKQTVRVRITDYPPFAILDKDDRPAGIAIDYLKLIAERTGVGFEYYSSGKTFSQALDGIIKHQGPDIMPLIVKTPDREKSIIFTNEYIDSPYMIFTRADNRQIIAHIDDLAHKKIALLRGTFFYKMMKRDYPDFSLMLYDNDNKAIEAVASGEADAYIGNMILASYLILNRGPYNLKIAAPTPFEKQRFSMGIRNDWPELAGIIEKGLASITPEEQAEIRNRYISIRYNHSDSAAIIKWILITMSASSSVILLFFFWNRILKKQVHKQTSAFRESEEKFRKLVTTAPYGIQLTDREGKILYSNPAHHRIQGYPDGELIGKYIWELMTDDHHRAKAKDYYQKLIKEQPVPDVFFNRDSTYDGRVIDVQINWNYIKSSAGEVEGVISVISDITKQKALESSVRDAQRMESIGNLAGGIAHDFNNILFPIVGMSELLLEDLPRDSIEYESAEEIFKAGKRGGDLVKQILEFSRRSEHKMRPTRIQNILREVIKLSRSTIPAYIEIKQDIQQDCGMVMADPSQLHQIGMNIITNAYHALEDSGGNISIKLNQIELEAPESTKINLNPGAYAMLSISDTGHGMSEELIGKIFDPYFTTKQNGKGTGLGLAVVYGIVKEHGGGVKVYSEIGKGSTFDIYLPLMKKTNGAESISAPLECQGGNERILLVDDENSIATLEKKMLERLGYKVILRLHSVEALEAFKANPSSFDLVITDMNMPNIPGDRLAQKIKSIRSDVPVVICTGFSVRINENNIKEMGIDGLLMKPIVKSDMAKVVRKVLDDAKFFNQE